MTSSVSVALVLAANEGPALVSTATMRCMWSFAEILERDGRFAVEAHESMREALFWLREQTGAKWLVVFGDIVPDKWLQERPVELVDGIHIMVCLPEPAEPVPKTTHLPITRATLELGDMIVLVGDQTRFSEVTLPAALMPAV